MNITVKFTNEVESKTLDVRRISLQKGCIVLHYMLGKTMTKHSESVENVERLYLEAFGSRGLMKAQQQEASTHECVRSLTMTKDKLVLEDVVDNVRMQHSTAPRQVDYLEIG